MAQNVGYETIFKSMKEVKLWQSLQGVRRPSKLILL
jgi:hypothetical protein